MADDFATPIGRVSFDDVGVMWHRLTEGIAITTDQAVETLDVLRGLAGDRPVPAVVDMRGVAFADRAARDVFGQSRMGDFELATALIVDSRISRALGNLYLRFSKPARPTQLFTSEQQARRWAHQFLD